MFSCMSVFFLWERTRYDIFLSYINNVDVHDRCQKILILLQYTAFVRLNSSGINYSLCILRAPVINSETKQANQTKRVCSLVNNVIYTY